MRLPLYLVDAAHPQARVCAGCEVRSGALFGALDPAGLERIHAHIAAPALAAGARLYGRGEAGGAVYTVRAGIVRFERVTEGGQRRILRLASRGDLIGQEALLGRAYSDDAVACTEVELCRIPPGLVEQLGDHAAPLRRELMLRWQRALDEAEGWATDLAAGSARRRMLKLLELLGRHADIDGSVWLPRRDEIGDMLDMTIETASRQVSRLRREAILELLPNGRRARVDAARLQAALAQEDA
ncbi:Crp/Fnr family transcriptional regulator [Piscinibacter sakaiensis]|uniref:Transcriptional regulator, Crp/Fnr family n=1 Tax=Piscinibacter sakaiensis TaxID=1547922 RepID=A0A0K8NTY6_PISS1|nr:Crp/Fnr family transcriptional regulator [Piscinibacter sakaiensis]GAP33881.1 transcriptional regulator, Crp/Fnr family [Piscinibacter sakaiensis]